jgi:hypothetical protein
LVGKTTMSRRNGTASTSPNGVAKGMGELTHDIVSLAELQFELFRSDCREGLRRMLAPLALLLVAGAVAVGAVPIALIAMAELLAQAAGLSRATAFAIAALGGFAAAVGMGVAGWFSLRRVGGVLGRSREEVARNMTWIKQALKRPVPVEAPPPPQDR